MIISLIAAMDIHRGIGKNNQLPWHLPEDLQHFKTLTLGKPVVMGRKTYLSIGKPLPNRTNIVITRDNSFIAPGCLVANSLEKALAIQPAAEEIMIIGGGILFEEALPRADRLYLTLIEQDFQADTFFPQWEESNWIEIQSASHVGKHAPFLKYRFVTLIKKI